MTNVHASTAWPSSSENDKGFMSLVGIQNIIQLAMSKHNLSKQEVMRFLSGQALKTLDNV
jgi:hypothetical protein